MKHRALLSAVAACLLVAACGDKAPPAAPPKPKVNSAANAAPLPPPAPTAAPASGGSDALKLAAATPPVQPQGNPKCNTPECTISIDVSSCAASGSGIVATPDPAPVDKANKQNPRMLWTITTPGFTFPKKDAIVFKDKVKADKEFTNCKLVGSGDTQYECKNKNDDGSGKARDFKYSITVLQGGKACATSDPIIINDA